MAHLLVKLVDSRAVERRREKKMKPEKQLYQWDTNQLLVELTPSAQFVDYPIGDEVIRIKSDGTRCRIPDEVLQTYGGKTCYERYPDGTYRAYSFSVLYAPKPPDYVYTPEERTTFEALTARVDSAIEEIKRRADSGEFTPVKGVDYFTDAEKAEMMESVSDGAIGEFRNVVDTATTEYNANASEKLTAYDTNAEQHTTDYNRNAEQKLEAYNQNHTAKVAEYNQNAETKTAEFDSNAAALQTEVDRLRGECDNLAAENRKQENRIDALIKLNKGQTYDVLQQESEAYSVDVPSGSKYASVDMVGGKSVVWNQLVEHGNFDAVSGWSGGTVSGNVLTITGTSDGTMNLTLYRDMKIPSGHKTLAMCDVYCGSANTARIRFPFNSLSSVSISANTWTSVWQIGISDTSTRVGVQMNGINGETYKYRNFVCFDLTAMFGSTIADYIYSLEQSQAGAGVAWFKQMFPADYYPYSEPTIISSQTDRVDVASADGTVTQQITTGFPVLNSAGSVYDYIDINERKLHQMVGVVDLGTLDWTYYTTLNAFYCKINAMNRMNGNLLCSRYTKSSQGIDYVNNMEFSYQSGINTTLRFKNTAYTDAATFKAAMSGVMLYYELAEEIITDIEIPTELADWLPVEAGGTVTFRNADESKQLAVPNAVSWVRKLNEVN